MRRAQTLAIQIVVQIPLPYHSHIEIEPPILDVWRLWVPKESKNISNRAKDHTNSIDSLIVKVLSLQKQNFFPKQSGCRH